MEGAAFMVLRKPAAQAAKPIEHDRLVAAFYCSRMIEDFGGARKRLTRPA
jgi:hypothetical protein